MEQFTKESRTPADEVPLSAPQVPATVIVQGITDVTKSTPFADIFRRCGWLPGRSFRRFP